MLGKKLSETKKNGRVYTPQFIVDNILDMSGYSGKNILKKHVIDNSCGDGAFLVRIVERYCETATNNNLTELEIKVDLQKYIHGIEIDKNECQKCIDNLSKIAKKYNLVVDKWDVICADALSINKFNDKMDFVLGNPPYVRVHNLGSSFDQIKQFKFAQNGMTDLFIVFFEIGIKMLNSNGVLGYITPNSYFNSLAGECMRKYFVKNNLLSKVLDLKHFQAFEATTYSAITILTKRKNNQYVEYYEFNKDDMKPLFIDRLTYNEILIANSFYFGKKNKLQNLANIITYAPIFSHFSVKNGYATLNDSVFINDFNFNDSVIPVVKASTGKKYKCIYPYTVDGHLIAFEKLPSNVQQYFEDNKKILQKRSNVQKNCWYGFGRTQGLKDTYRKKFALNQLVRNKEDIKLQKCDAGTGVYGGLYILSDLDEKEIVDLLCTDDFIDYISMLSKYKNGGYYTFSSHDVNVYLDYVYDERMAANE